MIRSVPCSRIKQNKIIIIIIMKNEENKVNKKKSGSIECHGTFFLSEEEAKVRD